MYYVDNEGSSALHTTVDSMIRSSYVAAAMCGISLLLGSCETEDSGSSEPAWEATPVAGVYSRYHGANWEVSNQTTGWVTVFVYFAQYGGQLTSIP